MTTKQIAESVGKDPATVARWVQEVSRKVQEVSRKVQEAKATSKPADYSLDESCLIIEEGMGKVAADVYRTNAANAELKISKEPKTSRLPSGTQMNALIRMADKGLISIQQFQIMVGAPPILKSGPHDPKALQISSQIPGIDSRKLTRQAYAVEMKAREKLESKKLAEQKNGDLFKGK